jgi:hypothetical protein
VQTGCRWGSAVCGAAFFRCEKQAYGLPELPIVPMAWLPLHTASEKTDKRGHLSHKVSFFRA